MKNKMSHIIKKETNYSGKVPSNDRFIPSSRPNKLASVCRSSKHTTCMAYCKQNKKKKLAYSSSFTINFNSLFDGETKEVLSRKTS
jgi:hypothetical protein